MVLLVRSFRSTLNLFQWFSFTFLISLSLFATYCVAANSISNDLTFYRNTLSDRKQYTDLIPTELVLVSTMDGSIRGIDRFQGTVHWTLKGGPKSSMIKSNSDFKLHKLYKPGPTSKMDPDDDRIRLFMDDVIGDENTIRDENYQLAEEPWETNGEEVEDSNVYYIIEPQDGGTLYLYSDGRPLEKLPFSIEKIVSESPFRTPDGTTYIGRKNTLMIEIDPRNGRILQQVDINKVDEEEYLIATKSQYPARTILLGRNEYKVTIYDSEYKKIWNVTYSEYITNKHHWDVPASLVPSDIYVAPDASQVITGVDVKSGNLIWFIDLPYPVVSIFNVYRRKDYTLAITRQDPPHNLSMGHIGDMLNMVGAENVPTAYVGVHEGTLYALSTQKYPLIRISQWSSMYTGRRPGDTSNLIEAGNRTFNGSEYEWQPKPPELCCHGCEYHIDCLVGQHRVQPLLKNDNQHLYLDPPTTATTTSTKPAIAAPTTRSLIHAPTVLPPPTYGYVYEDEPGFFDEGLARFWKSYLLIASVLVYVYRDRLRSVYDNKILPWWKRMMKKRAKAKKLQARITAAAKAEKERISRERADSTASRATESTVDEQEKPAEKEKESEPPKEESVPEEKKTPEPTKQVPVASKAISSSTGLDLEKFEQSKSRVLDISDHVLGYGSHGTVVYKGVFDGRQVAVKRLLLDFYDVALKEVKLLQESDDHPNVVRYFYKEESDRFLYIALELCFGSLNDYMERTLPLPEMQLCDAMDPANILLQITSGLQHLHSLKIVHRDIKPHNILLAPSKNRVTPQMRVLISDFGLCKKLDGEQSSFNYTAASPAGTSGWRAPELLAGALAATSSDTSLSSSTRDTTDPNLMMGHVKATRAIDVFSAGCVFYYVLSGGDHPFGNRFGRENNILLGNYDLSKLDSMGEDGVEAKDLLERMISTDPKSRPTANMIALHPFFWSTSKRLAFLQDASDRFEIEVRDPPSPLLQALESNTSTVIGTDWYKRIDRIVANDLGKFRKYDGRRIRDLLRALRNKKHHWQDLPEAVKKVYGEPPNQFLYYFTARFPHLLLHTYYVVASHPELKNEGSLGQYF